MEKTLINLIESFCLIVKKMMQAIYIPLKIDTEISWGVIACFGVIYLLTAEYNDKRKMTSGDLISLTAVYACILAVLTAYYIDTDKFSNLMLGRVHYLSPAIAAAGFIGLVVAVGWIGASGWKDATLWMLIVLYIPVILLILTNGRIVYENIEILREFKPQTRNPFDAGTDKKEKSLLCCRWMDPGEIEAIVNTHPAVTQSAVYIYEDENKILRPYLFIVSEPGRNCSNELRKDIYRFVTNEFGKKGLEDYKLPSWIECVSDIPLTAGGVDRTRFPDTLEKTDEIVKIVNSYPAVAESAVIFYYRENSKMIKSYAFVVLKPGISRSDSLKNDIRRFVKTVFVKKEMGPFYFPKEITFLTKLPKSGLDSVKVKQYELEKLIKAGADYY